MGGPLVRRWRVLVPLALLAMILMRLVWMQLRAYPPAADGRAKASWSALERRFDCRLERPDGAGVAWDGRPPRATALPSPGLSLLWSLGCGGGMLDEGLLIKMNQWMFSATVLFATLMARFATSSWTVALAVGAMLLSRGRLIADIARIGVDGMATLFVTAWLAHAAHFLRTGATVTALLSGALVIVAAAFDLSLAVLALSVPVLLAFGYLSRRRLARPVIQRLQATRRRMSALQSAGTAVAAWPAEDEGGSFLRWSLSFRWLFGMEYPPPLARGSPRSAYERGSLFRTINVPFLLWAYSQRRWLRMAAFWAFAGLLGIGLSFAVMTLLAGTEWATRLGSDVSPGHAAVWSTRWFVHQVGRFDLHLGTSLVIIVACALQSPAAGLPAFLELCWMTIISVVLVVLVAAVADHADAALLITQASLADPLPSVRSVTSWFEPAILTLGFAGLYNLLRVLDTRFGEQR